MGQGVSQVLSNSLVTVDAWWVLLGYFPFPNHLTSSIFYFGQQDTTDVSLAGPGTHPNSQGERGFDWAREICHSKCDPNDTAHLSSSPSEKKGSTQGERRITDEWMSIVMHTNEVYTRLSAAGYWLLKSIYSKGKQQSEGWFVSHFRS